MNKQGFNGGETRLGDRVPGRTGSPPSMGQMRRYSALTRRIIFFNAVALLVLIGGVILVQSSRIGLVDERLQGIKEQALIVASTLAEYTTDEGSREIKVDEAEPLLRQLIEPTRLRARLYETDGKLALDTRFLLARNVVETRELPPLDTLHKLKSWWDRIYGGLMGVRPFADLEPYFEAGPDGRVYHEVVSALSGEVSTAERVDDQNKLVLSVAVPIQRFKTVYGVLMVSTEGGDIDDILREERATLLEVFLVALLAMLLSSLYLAQFVATPIRRLAAAADRVRRGQAGRESIPLMEGRRDEISDLASSLSGMTRALYSRIDAIERFAADVAHELKNPLTSLKNAVEMFSRSKDEASRDSMIKIVQQDVKRIDRLITDISDASRLDAELSREEYEPVDIARLLETIVEVYTYTRPTRGVTLSLALDLPKDARVMGRDERLGQIFRNLIDNAISFSPDGGKVAISAAASGNRMRVNVADEGPGIPQGNLETIFDRFYTERPAGHEFGNNSGLGLSIARQIVTGVGGRIWAENRREPGAENPSGATFVVELPLAR
ncbi:MAG: stimulus-sensing domain-containing protein [Alphaproteobacteria bacterium]|nr:stimulus-sensing domain-containing protein [Alphaproteobacteria bacterium]